MAPVLLIFISYLRRDEGCIARHCAATAAVARASHPAGRAAAQAADFESAAARAFVVDSVRLSVFMGDDGRILRRGHPRDQTGGMDAEVRESSRG